MLVYNHSFKFREPYQVLVDSELVLDTFKASFDLVKGLKRTLQAEVKPMITQCCMQALYQSNNQAAIEIAKQFERRRCNHDPKNPKTPLECLESVVNINGKNKHRYVVATQAIDIRRKLRQVPGVPLVYMNRAVMVMEPLSTASESINTRTEEEKLFKGLNDPKYAGIAHDEEDNDPEEKVVQKKRKGPKQPNPLSIKKKKLPKTSATFTEAKNTGADGEKKTRKRRHKKSKNTEETDNSESTNIAQVDNSE